jgi:hypothetical protein
LHIAPPGGEESHLLSRPEHKRLKLKIFVTNSEQDLSANGLLLDGFKVSSSEQYSLIGSLQLVDRRLV